MGAFNYCPKCGGGIDRDEISVRDAIFEKMVCPRCGALIPTRNMGIADVLEDMVERITALEATVKKLQEDNDAL